MAMSNGIEWRIECMFLYYLMMIMSRSLTHPFLEVIVTHKIVVSCAGLRSHSLVVDQIEMCYLVHPSSSSKIHDHDGDDDGDDGGYDDDHASSLVLRWIADKIRAPPTAVDQPTPSPRRRNPKNVAKRGSVE